MEVFYRTECKYRKCYFFDDTEKWNVRLYLRMWNKDFSKNAYKQNKRYWKMKNLQIENSET